MSKGRKDHEKELAEYRGFLARMVDLLGGEPRVEYKESDHAGVMKLFFLSKQLTHAKSVLRLEGSRDSTLIARSMFEGHFLLRWALREPEPRALQWRAFTLVHDWRHLRRMPPQRLALPENQEKLAETEERLREHGHLLLTPKARKARSRGDAPLEDPYVRFWPVTKFTEILRLEDRQDGLYEYLYNALSAYHHWESPSMAKSVRRDESSVRYSSSNAEEESLAHVCALEALGETVRIVNDQYKNLPAEEVEKVRTEAGAFSERNNAEAAQMQALEGELGIGS